MDLPTQFDEEGVERIIPKIHRHKPVKITYEIEKKIIEIVSKNPREGYGLLFSTWSLRVLAGYISKEGTKTRGLHKPHSD